ncbi:MAG: DUF4350 domain-containing protein [Pirellulales bacterium]
MSESANTPTSGNLLSPRNLILAAVAVCLLSVVGMCWTMLRPNNSGGMGGDSFGTHRNGYRALFEILAESGVDVRRELAPPQANENADHTIAFLRPDARLVGFSPKFVQALLPWVEGGGRVLVALPPELTDEMLQASRIMGGAGLPPPPDILEILGVDDRIKRSESTPSGTTGGGGTVSGRASGRGGNFGWTFGADEPPPELVKATTTGSLAPLAPETTIIAVPGDKFATLDADPAKLDGSLSVRDAAGDDYLLVAVVQRGAGRIVLISEPQLLSNALLAKADNSVLAAHLLAPKVQPVVFDEFYHGLAVRGNPFYLLTRPGFAAVTLGILLGVGVWTWRQAVFLGPPLADRQPSRRDIGEYIDAMGDFFCRGAGHRRFLVREVRDGMLHQLCQELKLPPDKLDVDEITALLARRDPKRAETLRGLFGEIAAQLQSPREYPAGKFLPTMHRLAGMSK